MTPSARLSAAIELLDTILSGQPAGLTLTNWGRRSRYAGSRDRAAVRDIVFDCLRKKRCLATIGGGETGRAIVLAWTSVTGQDVAALFNGSTYAPDMVDETELNALDAVASMTDAVRLNYPDFLDAEFKRSLGNDFESVMAAMLERAPVDLRVNRQKGEVDDAIGVLAVDDIVVERVDLVPNALRIVDNHRRIGQSKAYKDGLVELQDASSQAVALFAEAKSGMRVLDYCAGGGGKALALYDAIDGQGTVVAHDIAMVRMNDLPARAARAGARIKVASPGSNELIAGGFDLVFADAPCSGTGSWRRTPDAKWRIEPKDIENLLSVQAEVLSNASRYVAPNGTLTYATCSLLDCENKDQISRFLEKNPDFVLDQQALFTPLNCGDGFYAVRLSKIS